MVSVDSWLGSKRVPQQSFRKQRPVRDGTRRGSAGEEGIVQKRISDRIPHFRQGAVTGREVGVSWVWLEVDRAGVTVRRLWGEKPLCERIVTTRYGFSQNHRDLLSVGAGTPQRELDLARKWQWKGLLWQRHFDLGETPRLCRRIARFEINHPLPFAIDRLGFG